MASWERLLGVALPRLEEMSIVLDAPEYWDAQDRTQNRSDVLRCLFQYLPDSENFTLYLVYTSSLRHEPSRAILRALPWEVLDGRLQGFGKLSGVRVMMGGWNSWDYPGGSHLLECSGADEERELYDINYTELDMILREGLSWAYTQPGLVRIG